MTSVFGDRICSTWVKKGPDTTVTIILYSDDQYIKLKCISIFVTSSPNISLRPQSVFFSYHLRFLLAHFNHGCTSFSTQLFWKISLLCNYFIFIVSFSTMIKITEPFLQIYWSISWSRNNPPFIEPRVLLRFSYRPPLHCRLSKITSLHITHII